METIVAFRINGGKVRIFQDCHDEAYSDEPLVFPSMGAAEQWVCDWPMFQSGQAECWCLELT